MAESTIAMIITVVALLFWATEIFPIGVTAVAVCIALVLTKTVSFTTAFSGFSSSLVMLISGMMVVGHALFKTGVAQLIGNAIVRRVGNHQLLAMALILSTAGIMSGFLSNVATMSMFIPVIAGKGS
ncbi:SLC13 family permease [Acetonema longum]|uniref:Anion transporter n=1 Tax=Acetonema longum DSM 6540 TaxID=1009370 RepID=F7NLN0_9FIRM|nr:SLC13 family permease [Acetonema longum]EGO63052.1 anion transporter [Acetonema longum DSM 6540]